MSNTTATRCYAHHHMTAQQYGFWDVCRSLAFKNNILFFNGRSIAARFKGMSKSSAYLLAESLLEGGWFLLLKDSTRRKDGTFSPKQYRVLSHEEWAEQHSGGCEPVQPAGMDDDSPVQPADSPVQPAGHNLLLKLPTINTSATESDNHIPFQPAGLVDFQNRFLKPKAFARERRSAAAPQLETAPVQPAGLDADQHSEAEKIATAIANTIGVTDQTERADWAVGMWKLLKAGHSPKTIMACATHAHTRCSPGSVRKNGPTEFVNSFDLIKSGLMNSQKGKTA